MAAFVAKQMVGNKLSAVKGMNSYFLFTCKILPPYCTVSIDFALSFMRFLMETIFFTRSRMKNNQISTMVINF